MTAGQLDTAINAYVWIDGQAAVYGPGLAVATGLWGVCRTVRALRRAADRVRLHLDLMHIEDHANQNTIREEKP
ncbi:hypothetical protein [Streptomyces sp. E5N298]|uniref:hypothetical protein n=1 Tax=Streptomyces sp. E5N298 TaxID=1851983 RepID=UPI000EF5FA0B|nr:hypothetical protein [Streptomyces sp. E5N298]